MDGRPDPLVSGLFRRLDERQPGAAAPDQVHGLAAFKLIEARQPPLKDSYDEWLARLICYAFSVPVSAFVSQVNRATGETLRLDIAMMRR